MVRIAKDAHVFLIHTFKITVFLIFGAVIKHQQKYKYLPILSEFITVKLRWYKFRFELINFLIISCLNAGICVTKLETYKKYSFSAVKLTIINIALAKAMSTLYLIKMIIFND